jgi:DNA-binding FrmR family transcriptional regulator
MLRIAVGLAALGAAVWLATRLRRVLGDVRRLLRELEEGGECPRPK